MYLLIGLLRYALISQYFIPNTHDSNSGLFIVSVAIPNIKKYWLIQKRKEELKNMQKGITSILNVWLIKRRLIIC